MNWEERALCRNDNDAADWFAAAGDHEARARALRVCQACPVRRDCLEEAIRLRFPGIWGGTSEAERLRMVRSS